MAMPDASLPAGTSERRPPKVTLLADGGEGLKVNPGVAKTTKKIIVDYYWPGMFLDIQRFLTSCPECQRFKEPKLQYGFMHHLPFRAGVMSWLAKSMGLHAEAYEVCLCFINYFSSRVILVPTMKKWTAQILAELFFSRIYTQPQDDVPPNAMISEVVLILELPGEDQTLFALGESLCVVDPPLD
ncbi:hypothetical protein BDK51DRAFT_43677 [Blyttiomyces helicus]|uniref:Integrase zinc-binding domain-containing protein n=1 Tax=Blyttiomyces helicus TaxID=388810 RepID=A0A4P9WIH9_9FUNG|nr:hypothetical protein BDK51DRAFT_43677 [Blyttiomyces helicus]|eukprot:RKO91693.1 hypothetical protein BDK51DRAFT_43677 [Blyttiomyces helicus]